MKWAMWPWTRCRAAMEPNDTPYWGRCERVRKHKGDHALERGMEIVYFETAVINFVQEWEY